jgi:NADPH:quinone reductase-like Zn-dependent oxidoreductase
LKAVTYEEYGPPEVLQIGEVETPSPGRSEVLVKIRTAIVSFGDCRMRSLDLSDIRFFERLFARLILGVRRPKRPVLGMGISGEVVSVGSNVRRFKVGDSVVAGTWHKMQFGGYAEYICIDEDGVIAQKPSSLTYDESVAAIGGVVALSFLRDANIRKGEDVLIYGASGAVGTTAVQLAKYFGANVTAVCSGANIDLVRSLGADKVIDYTREDFTTMNHRYNLVLDAVGKLTLSKVKNVLTTNGRYISALTSGHTPSGVKELTYLLDLADKGLFKPVIDRIYPLDEIVEAHRYVDSGRKRENVVLRIS